MVAKGWWLGEYGVTGNGVQCFLLGVIKNILELDSDDGYTNCEHTKIYSIVFFFFLPCILLISPLITWLAHSFFFLS